MRRALPSGRGILLAVLLVFSSASPAFADEIRVAAASNFRPVMRQLADRFEAASGHRVKPMYGSTGKHYAQISNGAPFDAFFAADAERPALLEERGRAVTGSRFTYAIGTLVLWSASNEIVDPDGKVLHRADFRHLAIANPDLAPYGAAAREVLLALGLWDALSGKLVRGENIGQAFQFVATGNAELGFVARSQLASADWEDKGSAWVPPRELYHPIEQQAVLIRDSSAGRAFLEFVRSDEARAIIRAGGYDLP